MVLLSEEVSD